MHAVLFTFAKASAIRHFLWDSFEFTAIQQNKVLEDKQIRPSANPSADLLV